MKTSPSFILSGAQRYVLGAEKPLGIPCKLAPRTAYNLLASKECLVALPATYLILQYVAKIHITVTSVSMWDKCLHCGATIVELPQDRAAPIWSWFWMGCWPFLFLSALLLYCNASVWFIPPSFPLWFILFWCLELFYTWVVGSSVPHGTTGNDRASWAWMNTSNRPLSWTGLFSQRCMKHVLPKKNNGILQLEINSKRLKQCHMVIWNHLPTPGSKPWPRETVTHPEKQILPP